MGYSHKLCIVLRDITGPPVGAAPGQATCDAPVGRRKIRIERDRAPEVRHGRIVVLDAGWKFYMGQASIECGDRIDTAARPPVCALYLGAIDLRRNGADHVP